MLDLSQVMVEEEETTRPPRTPPKSMPKPKAAASPPWKESASLKVSGSELEDEATEFGTAERTLKIFKLSSFSLASFSA